MTYLNSGGSGDTPTQEWNSDPALPIRCIREYDNTSTVVVAEQYKKDNRYYLPQNVQRSVGDTLLKTLADSI